MSTEKSPTLEKLLTAFEKAEQLRADTEALKPRLEKEIADVLDSGDALDEKIAASLQTKRGQLELCGPKLAQIAARMESLKAESQAQFQIRYNAFGAELRAMQDAATKKVVAQFNELGIDREDAEQLALRGVWVRTKLARQLGGLDSSINFHVSMGNIVLAARELLKSEIGLAQIKAGQSN